MARAHRRADDHQVRRPRRYPEVGAGGLMASSCGPFGRHVVAPVAVTVAVVAPVVRVVRVAFLAMVRQVRCPERTRGVTAHLFRRALLSPAGLCVGVPCVVPRLVPGTCSHVPPAWRNW
jgi:hypothetical protein